LGTGKAIEAKLEASSPWAANIHVLDDQNKWWVWGTNIKGIQQVNLTAMGMSQIQTLRPTVTDSIGNSWKLNITRTPASVPAALPQFIKPRTTLNTSLAQAVDLRNMFGLGAVPEIWASSNYPHVSVRATASASREYYKFAAYETGTLGTQVTVDIDRTNGFDSYIRILNESGSVVATNNDSMYVIDSGDINSSSKDSLLYQVSLTPGIYYIEVGRCCISNLASGNQYDLHVTLDVAYESDLHRPKLMKFLTPTLKLKRYLMGKL
jgi:hypothetical protein